MGTKNCPSRYDCYANAEPDEPMFVLLGRDRHAPDLVRAWANYRMMQGEDPDVVVEALEVAEAMERFRAKRHPEVVSDTKPVRPTCLRCFLDKRPLVFECLPESSCASHDPGRCTGPVHRILALYTAGSLTVTSLCESHYERFLAALDDPASKSHTAACEKFEGGSKP